MSSVRTSAPRWLVTPNGGRGAQGPLARRHLKDHADGNGLANYLTLAAIVFTIGIAGIILNHKNIIIILMSVELILLAVNINLIAFSTYSGDLTGQAFALYSDCGRGGGGDRPCDPRCLLPQSRLNRG